MFLAQDSVQRSVLDVQTNNWAELDRQNREKIINCDPTTGKRRTWIKAPAGGGKTTLLLSIAEKHPNRKFVLITYSKGLQIDVQKKIWKKGLKNIQARTVDSCCWAGAGGKDISNGGNLSIRNIVPEFWPRLQKYPWNKKGARNIGQVCQAALRCTGEFVPCKYHSQIDLENYVLPKLWGDNARLISHAGNRKTMHEGGHPLVPDDAGYDCILVDEVQDLDPQALELVDRCTAKVVFVGDPNQRIYGFSDNFKCECKFGSAGSIKLFPEDTITLYKTFRLNPGTVHSLIRNPALKMVAHRTDTVHKPIVETLGSTMPPIAYPGLCFLFRGNQELCEFALSTIPDGVNIVGARQILGTVRSFKNNKKNAHNRSKFANFCRNLGEKERERLCAVLNDRHTDSPDSDCFPVASSVHRAKGSEHRDVVLSKSVFELLHNMQLTNMDEEFNIAYVGASRHTRRLFIYSGSAVTGSLTDYKKDFGNEVQLTNAFLSKKRKREEEGGEACFF